jgi:hypothetical protein
MMFPLLPTAALGGSREDVHWQHLVGGGDTFLFNKDKQLPEHADLNRLIIIVCSLVSPISTVWIKRGCKRLVVSTSAF